MLRAEENEILTRVGPGTLMGELLRRYWTPACLTAEIPEPGSPPARVRLLDCYAASAATAMDLAFPAEHEARGAAPGARVVCPKQPIRHHFHGAMHGLQ